MYVQLPFVSENVIHCEVSGVLKRFSKVEKGLKRELMTHKVLKFMSWQLKRMFHDQLSEGETPFEKQ